MKQKIKTTLIHWLGGMTVEESKESDMNSWAIGVLNTLYAIKGHMDSINGTPADDWCKNVYSMVADFLNEFEGKYGTDVERPDTACQADA